MWKSTLKTSIHNVPFTQSWCTQLPSPYQQVLSSSSLRELVDMICMFLLVFSSIVIKSWDVPSRWRLSRTGKFSWVMSLAGTLKAPPRQSSSILFASIWNKDNLRFHIYAVVIQICLCIEINANAWVYFFKWSYTFCVLLIRCHFSHLLRIYLLYWVVAKAEKCQIVKTEMRSFL